MPLDFPFSPSLMVEPEWGFPCFCICRFKSVVSVELRLERQNEYNKIEHTERSGGNGNIKIPLLKAIFASHFLGMWSSDNFMVT